MLISARLDVSRSPTRNLGSTAKVRSRKCHLLRTNDGPAALPGTVSKPCEQYKGGCGKPVLGPFVWPKRITKLPVWPLLPSTQPNSSDLPWLTDRTESINMASVALRNNPCKKQPVLPFLFFATSLRLCSQTPSTATQWKFMGRS